MIIGDTRLWVRAGIIAMSAGPVCCHRVIAVLSLGGVICPSASEAVNSSREFVHLGI